MQEGEIDGARHLIPDHGTHCTGMALKWERRVKRPLVIHRTHRLTYISSAATGETALRSCS